MLAITREGDGLNKRQKERPWAVGIVRALLAQVRVYVTGTEGRCGHLLPSIARACVDGEGLSTPPVAGRVCSRGLRLVPRPAAFKEAEKKGRACPCAAANISDGHREPRKETSGVVGRLTALKGVIQSV